jgi:hypothetical protein
MIARLLAATDARELRLNTDSPLAAGPDTGATGADDRRTSDHPAVRIDAVTKVYNKGTD